VQKKLPATLYRYQEGRVIMKIKPKVYWFVVQAWRLENGKYIKVETARLEGYVVARTEQGAAVQVKEYWKKTGRKYKTTIQLLEDSWIANMLSMLVPNFYRFTKGEWKQVK
jgi:hypothetical protein